MAIGEGEDELNGNVYKLNKSEPQTYLTWIQTKGAMHTSSLCMIFYCGLPGFHRGQVILHIGCDWIWMNVQQNYPLSQAVVWREKACREKWLMGKQGELHWGWIILACSKMVQEQMSGSSFNTQNKCASTIKSLGNTGLRELSSRKSSLALKAWLYLVLFHFAETKAGAAFKN